MLIFGTWTTQKNPNSWLQRFRGHQKHQAKGACEHHENAGIDPGEPRIPHQEELAVGAFRSPRHIVSVLSPKG